MTSAFLKSWLYTRICWKESKTSIISIAHPFTQRGVFSYIFFSFLKADMSDLRSFWHLGAPRVKFCRAVTKSSQAEAPTAVRMQITSWCVELNRDLEVWGHAPSATLRTRTRINKFIPSCSRQTDWQECGREVMKANVERLKCCSLWLLVITQSVMLTTNN